MRGLLRKDFYVSAKFAGSWLVAVIIFCVIPVFRHLGITYAALLACLVLFNSIYSDMACQWDLFAAMLPYRIEEIVLSKYLTASLCTLPAGAAVLLGEAVQAGLEPGSVNWQYAFCAGLMQFELMLLVLAVSAPTIYRYGTIKGRVIMAAAMVAGFLLFMPPVFMSLQYGPPSLVLPLLTLPPFPTAVLLAVLLAGVLYGSFRLSVYFYRNRRYGAYDNE